MITMIISRVIEPFHQRGSIRMSSNQGEAQIEGIWFESLCFTHVIFRFSYQLVKIGQLRFAPMETYKLGLQH